MATTFGPRFPPAPGRLSMMTCWPQLGQLLADDARDDVRRSSGREGDDDSDWPRWIAIGLGRKRPRKQQGHGQQQRAGNATSLQAPPRADPHERAGIVRGKRSGRLRLPLVSRPHADHPRLSSPSSGPTAVPERIRQATALPILNHRGAEFKAMLAECQQRLKPIFGTAHDVLLFAGSGTAMMEAALANMLGPGDAVLIIVAGQFGDRFVSIAKALGASIDTVDVEWGRALDAQRVAERLKQRPYRAVVMVHNESSTGVAYDVAAVGAVVRDTPALLVVDSVSGLAGIAMKMDAWGADIVVSASQKSLMCAPGIGLAAISAKAWKIIDRDGRVPSFFADFRRAKASLDKGRDPLHAAGDAGLRPARGVAHDRRGGPGQRPQAPQPPRRGLARRRAGARPRTLQPAGRCHRPPWSR